MLGLNRIIYIVSLTFVMIVSGSSQNVKGSSERDSLSRYVLSNDFNRDDFPILFWKFYDSYSQSTDMNSGVWEQDLYALLDAALSTKDPERFRALVKISSRDGQGHLIFDPTRVLYDLVEKNGYDDDLIAKLIRTILGLGADPLFRRHNLTAAEILIGRNKPALLGALLENPSPVSGDVFNQGWDSGMDTEIYRTKVIRQAIRADQGSDALSTVLKNSHYYTFVDRYLTKEVILIGFTMVVFTLIFFLYQLRIKRVPINSKLMIPRIVANRNPWWLLLTYSTSTLLSSVPTSNLFESIGTGLASFGGVVWSYLYTGRADVGLVLVLSIVIQSVITLAAYYSFAPTNDNEDSDKFEEEIDPSSHLYRVMFYPKSRDISQALTNCAIYLLANTVSFMILFSALDPVHRMYTDCPGVSISDTYGQAQTLTRSVAMTWDVVIFYCISIRIYRVLDTVNVYGLLARSGGQKNLPI